VYFGSERLLSSSVKPLKYCCGKILKVEVIDMYPTIRDALTTDFDEIASLSVEAYREYSKSLSLEDWDKMKTSLSNISKIAERAKLIVAEQDRELVGSVAYYHPGTSASHLFQPEWASLRMLAVSPKYRGQGIGRKLTQECIQRAKSDRAKVIGLHTSELMVAARCMYEKLGFQQDTELPRNFGIRYWRYILKLAES
jgi:ribosomal protein S18 acetylase RimI-like enzyme